MENEKNNLRGSEHAGQKAAALSKPSKGFWGKMIEKLDKAVVKKANSSSCCGGGSGKSKCC